MQLSGNYNEIGESEMKREKQIAKYEKQIAKFGDLSNTMIREIACEMTRNESFKNAIYNNISHQFLRTFRNTPSQQLIFIQGYSSAKNLLALQLATERNNIANAEDLFYCFRLRDFINYLQSLMNREVRPVGIHRAIVFEIPNREFQNSAMRNILSFTRSNQIDVTVTSAEDILYSHFNCKLYYFGLRNGDERAFRFLVKIKEDYIGYVILPITLPSLDIETYYAEMDKRINEIIGKGGIIDQLKRGEILL